MEKILQLPKNLIWITLINYAYIDYTKNFLKSMEISKSKFKLVVFCIDVESFECLQAYENCIPIFTDFLQHRNLVSNFNTWGTREYKKICFAKLDVILYALQNSYAESIGYIDMDVVLLKDPTTTLIQLMNANKLINVFSQCDELTECQNPKRCKNICAGIMVFRNVNIIYKLFEYSESDIFKYTFDDQEFLNLQLRNIYHCTVDNNLFLKGCYPNIQKVKIQIPKSAVLIHFNCIVGKKIDTMKLQDLWYI